VDRPRLALIGAGWIARIHLTALDRLDRTDLVAVAAQRIERAREMATPRVARAYDDIDRMLDEERPDVAWVCVPPGSAIAVVERLVERGIPFLTEKPLAATDAEGPRRVAAGIAERGIVAAVGYHLRALERLPEVRERLAANPARLVVARWQDATPAAPWWRTEAEGGGQVIEQATHLYDLARSLLGEAEVVGAASVRDEPTVPPGADVVDATAAVLRFGSGAVGSFANTRRQATSTVEISFTSNGLLTTIRRTASDPAAWEITFADDRSAVTHPPGRDPFETQAAAFLDAVDAGDPDRVLSPYGDAVKTDRLTRAVVAATGRGG
jgi:myo-inositol 2-dehydrogenase/D-chiro-inositol 1-dehydrogenase